MTNEEIWAEKSKIENTISEIKRELIAFSRYKKATEALLAELETAYDESQAATKALTDDEWKKNFG